MKHHTKEQGQGLVEYALLLVLVAIVVIAALMLLGPQINAAYVRVIAGLNGQELTGSGEEYVITGFNVSITGGPAVCTVRIRDITVMYLIDGTPAPAGRTVSVSANVTGGGAARTGSGSTNANGTATIDIPGFTNANCSGTATVTGGPNNASKSQSY